jgi:hypothetical protein
MDGALFLVQHVHRRQPGAGEISEAAADNVRAIANTVADKADDILNQPAYNKDGLRQVGYIEASISEREFGAKSRGSNPWARCTRQTGDG